MYFVLMSLSFQDHVKTQDQIVKDEQSSQDKKILDITDDMANFKSDVISNMTNFHGELQRLEESIDQVAAGTID